MSGELLQQPFVELTQNLSFFTRLVVPFERTQLLLGRAAKHFVVCRLHPANSAGGRGWKVSRRRGALRPWLGRSLRALSPGQADLRRAHASVQHCLQPSRGLSAAPSGAATAVTSTPASAPPGWCGAKPSCGILLLAAATPAWGDRLPGCSGRICGKVGRIVAPISRNSGLRLGRRVGGWATPAAHAFDVRVRAKADAQGVAEVVHFVAGTAQGGNLVTRTMRCCCKS